MIILPRIRRAAAARAHRASSRPLKSLLSSRKELKHLRELDRANQHPDFESAISLANVCACNHPQDSTLREVDLCLREGNPSGRANLLGLVSVVESRAQTAR